MKYRSLFLELAEIDLHDVLDYLAGYSLQAAHNFLDNLDKRLSQICEFPKSCEVYRHNPALRRAIIGNYLLFYEADEKAKVINIYRILHGSRNIETINLLSNIDN